MPFFNLDKVQYAGPNSEDPFTFKYYNKDAVVAGRKMSEWTRFSVCFWHTFRGVGTDPFGSATLIRPWETSDSSVLEICKKRVDAAFEFFVKLGVEY